MHPILKNEAWRAILSFTVKKITGTDEFIGSVKLKFRDGGLRRSEPNTPKDVNKKELAYPILEMLSNKRWSGVFYIDINRETITNIRFEEKLES